MHLHLFFCGEKDKWVRKYRDTERSFVLLTISNYVKPKTLEEAYELNQARNSRVMGGMMWMRLGNAKVKTIIDLSGLGLDKIEAVSYTHLKKR